MKTDAFAATDIGRVRDENQDAYFVDRQGGLYLVADGMGGHRGGSLASRMVTDLLPRMLTKGFAGAARLDEAGVRARVIEAVRALDQEVAFAGMRNPAVRGMGSTMALLRLRGNRAFVANTGDSRAYLFRSGRLRQLTEDHTQAAAMLKYGLIAKAEARRHHSSHILTACVGMGGGVWVAFRTVPVRRGDRFLLCSDGLTGPLSDKKIAGILSRSADCEAAVKELIREANGAGGEDNVTAVLVRLG